MNRIWKITFFIFSVTTYVCFQYTATRKGFFDGTFIGQMTSVAGYYIIAAVVGLICAYDKKIGNSPLMKRKWGVIALSLRVNTLPIGFMVLLRYSKEESEAAMWVSYSALLSLISFEVLFRNSIDFPILNGFYTCFLGSGLMQCLLKHGLVIATVDLIFTAIFFIVRNHLIQPTTTPTPNPIPTPTSTPPIPSGSAPTERTSLLPMTSDPSSSKSTTMGSTFIPPPLSSSTPKEGDQGAAKRG